MNLKHEDYMIISLVTNPEFSAKVFLKMKEYFFENYFPQEIFRYMKHCSNNDSPYTYDTITMLINNDIKKTDDSKKELIDYINSIRNVAVDVAPKILMQQTEKWAKFNAFKNAWYESMLVLNKDKSNESFQKVMGIIENGFNINLKEDDEYSMSFDDEEDRKKRIRELRAENCIMTGFKPFDDLTGGLRPRTLTCLLAPTNHGKTLTKAHLASYLMLQGYNVAIASLEITPSEYLQRIDANMLDISTRDMLQKNEAELMQHFNNWDKKYQKHGKIEVHQFSEATVIHIKMWLKNLYIEKKFIPDVVIIDYMGLMSGITVRDRSNTYVTFKEISREIRQHICIDMGIPVITSMQSNRAVEDKIKSKGKQVEVSSSDTADSYGVPHNLDTYISQVEIKQAVQGQLSGDMVSCYLWRLIKSRNHIETGTRSMVGVSKLKQRLIELKTDNIDIMKNINNTVVDAEVNKVLDSVRNTADEKWLSEI